MTSQTNQTHECQGHSCGFHLIIINNNDDFEHFLNPDSLKKCVVGGSWLKPLRKKDTMIFLILYSWSCQSHSLITFHSDCYLTYRVFPFVLLVISRPQVCVICHTHLIKSSPQMFRNIRVVTVYIVAAHPSAQGVYGGDWQ